MYEIMRADFELRKILTNGQRTEDQEIKTDTLVLGNTNLEMRVKGEPHNFKDFIPGTLITVTFTQSQVTLEAFDEAQEANTGQDERDEEQYQLAQAKGATATRKELEAEEAEGLEEVE